MKQSGLHVSPFLRLLPPFIIGVITADHSLPPVSLWYAISLLLLVLFRRIMHRRLFSYRYHTYTGILLFVQLYCCGWIASGTKSVDSSNRIDTSDSSCVLIVRVDEPVKSAYQASVLFKNDRNGIKPIHGMPILIYTSDSMLATGDCITVRPSNLQPVRSSQNPFVFDYARYLSRQGIHQVVYLDQLSYGYAKGACRDHISLIPSRIRNSIRDRMHQALRAGPEFAVAEALLYGYDDDIPADITQAYATTGTLHVLAVSGMHVGLILVILNYLFAVQKFIPGLKRWRIPVVIIMLWIYALICGMSPSILRATVMFSLMLAGESFNKHPNSLNTLAASAFVLIALEPYFLFQSGFLLSYSAVAGILLIHPLIHPLWIPGHRISEMIWSLISVSIAAQIGTFPVSLFLFHQFPLIFILSNLLIIPITTLLIYLLLILLVCVSIPILSSLLAAVCFWLIQSCNQMAVFFANLPYASIRHIPFRIEEVVYAYLAIFSVLWLMVRISFYRLRITLIILIFLSITYQLWGTYTKSTESEYTFFMIPKHDAIMLHHPSKLFVWSNIDLTREHQLMERQVMPTILHYGLEVTFNDLPDTSWLRLSTPNHSILISGKGYPDSPFADILYLRKGYAPRLFDSICCRLLIMSPSIRNDPPALTRMLHNDPFSRVIRLNESGYFTVHLTNHE